MISVREFRDRAAECARLARTIESRPQRDMLFAMARTLETLAKQTARFEALKSEQV